MVESDELQPCLAEACDAFEAKHVAIHGRCADNMASAVYELDLGNTVGGKPLCEQQHSRPRMAYSH
jgi:hypothetical protein